MVGHQLEADMVESNQTIENMKKIDVGIMNRKHYVVFKLHQKNFCLRWVVLIPVACTMTKLRTIPRLHLIKATTYL